MLFSFVIDKVHGIKNYNNQLVFKFCSLNFCCNGTCALFPWWYWFNWEDSWSNVLRIEEFLWCGQFCSGDSCEVDMVEVLRQCKFEMKILFWALIERISNYLEGFYYFSLFNIQYFHLLNYPYYESHMAQPNRDNSESPSWERSRTRWQLS